MTPRFRTRTLGALCVWLCLAAPALAGPLDAGNDQYKAGQYAQAVTSFQQAVGQTQGREQAEAYWKLGNAYHKLRQNPQALDAYNHAQQIAPSLSFASSPDKFRQAVARVSGGSQSTSGRRTPPQTRGGGGPDPVLQALSAGNVYVDPRLPGINQRQLEQAALQGQDNPHTRVDIAVLATLPPPYRSLGEYAGKLHQNLGLGKNGLVLVVFSGRAAGAQVVTGELGSSEDARLATQSGPAILRDRTAGTAALAQAVAADINSHEYRGSAILMIIFLIAVVVIVLLVSSASRQRKQRLLASRQPVEALRANVLSGIEYVDGYADVLPKNNPDSDQVRAFRQSADGKFEQAVKILDRATEVSDIQRAQGLLQGAQADIGQARRYLDRATGGTGNIPGDDAVRPQSLPETEQAVQSVPQDQRGVSFFSSQPAPLGSLVPVTITVNGQSRQVLATPEEADELRRGRMPQVRAFQVGGQYVPWYEYNSYDPYRDYWRYQNSGWGGFGGGVVAGLVGAELLGDLFAPRVYGGFGGGYGGGFGYGGFGGGSPWAFSTDNDYYRGYYDAEQQDRAAQSSFGDYNNAPNYDTGGGTSFMGGGGPGYDTQGYDTGGGTSFMGGGGGMAATSPEPLSLPGVGGLAAGPPDAPETLLFLHGWGGSKELWWGTMQRMGTDCRCIALDLPGVGGTPLPPDLQSMADFARWLVGVCDRLDLPPVTLVGHSLGGNLAAQVALASPDRVRRLVLVDAALDPARFPARARWPLSPQYGLLALRLARWSVWPLALAGRRIPHAHGGGFWIPFARRNHYYLAANSDAAMQTQLRALMGSTHRPEPLAALSMPILIVHGGRDDIIPVALARSLAASLPSAELSIFPTAHHCPMDSDPPKFAQTLRGFLTRPARRATMGDAEDGPRETAPLAPKETR